MAVIATVDGPWNDPPLVEEADSQTKSSRSCGACFMYARMLARFWYVIFLLVIMTVAAFGTLAFALYERPDFSNPAKGFTPRGTTISSRVTSVVNFANDTEDLLTSYSLDTADAPIPTSAPMNVTLELNSGIQLCHSISHWGDWLLTLVFEGVDQRNVLTSEAIKSVCKAEERLVTSHPLYQNNCLCLGNFTDRDCPDNWSIGNYIALMSNKTSCEEIEDTDVEYAMDLMVLCAPFVYSVSRSELDEAVLPDSFPDQCRQHDFAIHTILYYLLPAKFSQDILDGKTPLESPVIAAFLPVYGEEKDLLQAIYLNNIKKGEVTDGITRLVAVDADIKRNLFSDVLVTDTLVIAAVSGIVFLLILWVYTGSLMITVAASLNMVFSLVLAYFFVTVVFVRPFFPFANVLTMVLIAGVGADDTFVFVDLWRKIKADLGVENFPRLVDETLRHATVTMTVTSLTTASALYAATVSDITVVRCFAVFAGTTIMMNLALTLTLLPAVVIMHEKMFTVCSVASCARKAGLQKRISDLLQCLKKPLKVSNEVIIPFLVSKLRYMWIVLFHLLLVGGVVVVFIYPGLQVPTQSERQFFIASDYLEQFDFVYKNQFAYKEQRQSSQLIGCVFWGVLALDNGDHWDPDDFGKLVLDDTFQISTREEQSWLLDFCQDIRNQTFFQETDTPLVCFMEDFMSLMQQRICINPLTGEDASPCCDQQGFPYEPSLFNTCIAKFARKGFLPTVFFHNGTSEPAAIKIIFPTSFPQSFSYAMNDEMWTTINPWIESKMMSAPDSLKQGWFVPNGTHTVFYDLQQSLAAGTLSSMLITLGIASIVLFLSIQNILLTIGSMLTITSAVLVTVASLVLLGWELGVIEATIITLALGLSVDYTLHFGVAYKLAPCNDRTGRTRYSLLIMTPAITMAALTTFVAGSVALQSVVLVFYQFGVFLMLVMTMSWSHSTFFFQSLCIVFGPQDSCGNIPSLRQCHEKSIRPRNRTTTVHPNYP